MSRNWNCYAMILELLVVVRQSLQLTDSNFPRLLVVSFDGFRYDYIDKTNMTNLKNLINSGGYVRELSNIFTTKTFPNHHSIATGQYAEDHGVIANTVYDSQLKKVLSGRDAEMFTYNSSIVPIWTLNELAHPGRYSGSVMWVGAEYEIANTTISHIMEFNESFPWEKRVDTVISWFLDSQKPANLIMMYIEEPDSTGHRYGPDSPEVIAKLQEIDHLLGYLINKLEENLLHDLNMIITTDHGMIYTPKANLIDLDKIIKPEDYKYYGVSPVLNIFPNEGKAAEIYLNLSLASKTLPFNVYKRHNVPPRYHYSKNHRIGDIVVEAHSGYFFQDYNNLSFHKYGSHGYDNQLKEMHGLLVTSGRSFSHTTLEKASNLDIYSLMCHLLKLNAPLNSGNFSHMEMLLVQPVYLSSGIIYGLALSITCVIILALVYISVSLFKYKRNKRLADLGTALLESKNTLKHLEEEEHLLSPSCQDILSD